MNQKQLFPVALMSAAGLLFGSCAIRTYTISEKTAFTPTKYDITLDSAELSEMPTNEKERLLSCAEIIIDSIKSVITENDGFSLSREYFSLNDSVMIEYLTYVPQDYVRTMVFFIGNQSRQTSYVNYLQKLSVETGTKIYSWNYRGYGYSSGKSSFNTQFDDNQHLFSLIKCRESNKEFIVAGYSLGSVFASKLGSNNEADKLILLAPVSDVRDMLVHYERQIMKGFKFIFRPFIDLKVREAYVNDISNTNEIKKFKGELLVVHSKDDDQLPYSMGKRLYKSSPSANKKMITTKKGGHGAPMEDENWNEIINWINSGYKP